MRESLVGVSVAAARHNARGARTDSSEPMAAPESTSVAAVIFAFVSDNAVRLSHAAMAGGGNVSTRPPTDDPRLATRSADNQVRVRITPPPRDALLLERERVQRIARADDHELTAVEQERLRAVARVDAEPGMPERLAGRRA